MKPLKVMVSGLCLAVVAASCANTATRSTSTADPATSAVPARQAALADSSKCAPNHTSGTITIWHSMGGNPALDIWEQFTKEFEQDYPVHLELRKFSDDADLIKALIGIPKAQWPDVVLASEQATRTLLDSGGFLAPSTCDPSLGADLLPLVAATYTVDQRLVALPFGVSTPVLVFDAAKFRRADLDPAAPPKTLPELLAAAAKIRASGAASHGLVMSDWCGNYLADQFAAKRGVPIGSPDNGRGSRTVTVDYASPAIVSDLTAVRDEVWNGDVLYIGPNSSNFDDLVLLTVSQGGAAMAVHTSGALGEVVQLLKGGNLPGVELGVGPLPGPGAGGLVGGNVMWLTDSANPTRVGRAWSLLDWLYRPEHLARLAAATGYVPDTAAAAADPVMTAAWAAHPQLKVAYDQVMATPVNNASAGLLMGPFQDRASALYDMCNRVLENGTDVKLALTDASNSVNYLIAEYEARHSGTPPPTTTVADLGPMEKTTLGGSVACASGAEVVGIWVDVRKGGSGWATLGSATASGTPWSFDLQRPGEYQLHVGCGGTKEKWATSYFSQYVSQLQGSFVCHDTNHDPHGLCSLV